MERGWFQTNVIGHVVITDRSPRLDPWIQGVDNHPVFQGKSSVHQHRFNHVGAVRQPALQGVLGAVIAHVSTAKDVFSRALIAPHTPVSQGQEPILVGQHGVESVACQVMLNFNACIRHPMHHRIQPIATRQAVVARGLGRTVGDQGEVRHGGQTEGLAGRIHVVVLHVVPLRVVHVGRPGRVGRLCE